MRRADREIRAFDEIVAVLDRCDTIRLGLHGDDGYPYVVPLSFGYAVEDGVLALYVHGAHEGLKHRLLAADNRVCVEADRCLRFAPHGDSYTCAYESVIGFGRAEIVTGEQAVRGLDLLVAHCGFPGGAWNRATLPATRVYRIALERVTGKQRIL